MICYNCGAECHDYAKFCLKCGAALSQSAAAGAIPQPEERAQTMTAGTYSTEAEQASPGLAQPFIGIAPSVQQPSPPVQNTAPQYQQPQNYGATPQYGAQQYAPPPVQQPYAQPYQYARPASGIIQAPKIEKAAYFWISKICILFSILCWFLPFTKFEISKHLAYYTGPTKFSATGFEIIFEIRDMDFGNKYIEEDMNYTSFYYIWVMLILIVALFIPRGTTGLVALATSMLLLEVVVITVLGNLLKEATKGYLSLSCGYGLILAIALLITGMIFMLVECSYESKKRKEAIDKILSQNKPQNMY